MKTKTRRNTTRRIYKKEWLIHIIEEAKKNKFIKEDGKWGKHTISMMELIKWSGKPRSQVREKVLWVIEMAASRGYIITCNGLNKEKKVMVKYPDLCCNPTRLKDYLPEGFGRYLKKNPKLFWHNAKQYLMEAGWKFNYPGTTKRLGRFYHTNRIIRIGGTNGTCPIFAILKVKNPEGEYCDLLFNHDFLVKKDFRTSCWIKHNYQDNNDKEIRIWVVRTNEREEKERILEEEKKNKEMAEDEEFFRRMNLGAIYNGETVSNADKKVLALDADLLAMLDI
jgi:hypothetical protein